jgi:hypothetical protein
MGRLPRNIIFHGFFLLQIKIPSSHAEKKQGALAIQQVLIQNARVLCFSAARREEDFARHASLSVVSI